ncbi:TPA: restriction endonuclease subunit S [Campylobacter coli]|nr:restriction endonuclease subunit S [Campylobacter coli]HEB9323019.1 restriction endonuclease subunit S [Campylobacter coli]
MSKTEVVWFKDLNRWDVGYYINNIFNSKYPLYAFGEFLAKYEAEWEVLVPDKSYPILGVRSYGMGVYKNRIALGKSLITKTTKQYQKIKSGNLFWCKVDTKNGAFGITKKEHNICYASHNMIQAEIIKDVIIPDFLQHLFACEFFYKFLDSRVTGTTNRQYISFKELMQIKIPLPPLEIQREIVEKIKNIQDKIKALQNEEKRLKEEIEAYLYITLGLERKQEKKKQKVFVMEFKNLDRWDVKHNQDDVGNSNKVSFESIENIVRYMQRGKTPKYSNIKQYPVIAQKCIQWNGIDMKKSLFIDPDSIKNYTQDRFLQDDDILLNSTGIGTLGRVALYKSTINPYAAAVADGHVTVLRFDKDKILPNYFYCYFSSSMIQDSIEEYATGSTKQKELSLSLVKQIQIPLPPLEIQKQIVEHIESKQKIIEDNKYKIENLQSDINKELQELILA